MTINELLEAAKARMVDTPTCEEHAASIKEGIERQQALLDQMAGTPTKRANGLFRSVGISADMLSQAGEAALATLTIAAHQIPGDLRVDFIDEADTRTFTIYKGEIRVGTLILDVCSRQSGQLGGGVRLMVNQDIVGYGLDDVKVRPSSEN